MPSSRQTAGSRSEALAADLLTRKGFRILEQNVRVGKIGEIDLLCEDRGTLVFVEVRSRGSAQGASAIESVTFAKLQQVKKTIRSYLAWHPVQGPWRVDVVAIQWSQQGKGMETQHFENVTI